MDLNRLADLTARHFNLPKEDLSNGVRGLEDLSIARHCFRAIAAELYGATNQKLSDFMNCNPATVHHSKKLLLQDGVYAKEYADYKAFVALNDVKATDVAVDPSGIERITNEAYDERFYKSPSRLNPKTNNPFFPSFHFITSMGAPEPIGLTKWRQDKGHFADYILERSSVIGSYVHDCIDRMIKTDSTVMHEDIHRDFPNHKEAQRVKDCLLGFMNFIRDEEPIITASEQMMCGLDFGFTFDAKMKLKSDDYKKESTVDWKTSKTVNEDHKMQVEAMRRVSKTDKGVVVVLGNSTKKKYTATHIKPSEQDFLWQKFQAVKETAYVELLKRGTVKPREDNMPSVFGLKELTFKRKL